mmetsp:Transcript_43028/g.136750  ORF Transcript_43028/g.136750 Transcript_43028/m.136750 type:complete len:286 (-) Transcript_43028:1152-2009(-)
MAVVSSKTVAAHALQAPDVECAIHLRTVERTGFPHEVERPVNGGRGTIGHLKVRHNVVRRSLRALCRVAYKLDHKVAGLRRRQDSEDLLELGVAAGLALIAARLHLRDPGRLLLEVCLLLLCGHLLGGPGDQGLVLQEFLDHRQLQVHDIRDNGDLDSLVGELAHPLQACGRRLRDGRLGPALRRRLARAGVTLQARPHFERSAQALVWQADALVDLEADHVAARTSNSGALDGGHWEHPVDLQQEPGVSRRGGVRALGLQLEGHRAPAGMRQQFLDRAPVDAAE